MAARACSAFPAVRARPPSARGAAGWRIRSCAGDDRAPGPNKLRTGLLGAGGSDKARHVFSGLDIAGRNITGYSLSTLDTSGPSAGAFSGLASGTAFLSMSDSDLDGSLDRLSFNLEDLRFVARSGVTSFNQNYADFTIGLISAPVGTPPPSPPNPMPEPGSLTLAFAALAVLGAAGRKRVRLSSPAPRPSDTV